MGWIRRSWTPDAAEEWTKEDLVACILSALAYMTITAGLALALLLRPSGYILLAIGLLSTLFMYLVIDPKLSTISEEYEKKQKSYLERLERITRWEEDESE